MTVPVKGKYFISANQHSKRHHTKEDEEFNYSSVWLIIGKPEGNDVKFINADFKADREVWTEDVIEAGEYYIYVKVAWLDKGERDFVLSSYGPEDVSFT